MHVKLQSTPWVKLSGTSSVIQIWQTKLVYMPASHEVSLFFIGCQSSPSLPVAVKPCNAISQLLHFNTAQVLQNSSHDVFLSPWAHLQGSGSSLIFTISRAMAPSCLLLTDTLLCPKYVIFKRIWAKYLRSDGIVELFHSPFPNCHLQLNQPCVSLFGLLFLVLSLTTNAVLILRLSLSFHCPVIYAHPQTWTPAHALSWTHACTDTPYINTQRPAAYQIGTAGINT